MIELKLD